MNINKIIYLGLAASLFVVVSQPVSAQDRYEYCQHRAAEISGYRGHVPDRYLPGGALRGAARGATGAVVGGAVFDRNKRQRRRDLRRGAAIGAVVGSIRRSHAKHEQENAARDYRAELDNCMRGGY